jgi:hypothetical protein
MKIRSEWRLEKKGGLSKSSRKCVAQNFKTKFRKFEKFTKLVAKRSKTTKGSR